MVINNKILEDYFNYLTVIRDRSPATLSDFRVDLRMLFRYIYEARTKTEAPSDCSFADIDFIKSIRLDEIYAYIAYCQKERHCVPATIARKIITFRQFWKYLKTKAHLIDNNVTDELESPKVPKFIPKYLSLEDSIRLLMTVEDSPRNYCIITLFLNCALRLSELVNLDVDEVTSENVTVIGKGRKERQIYLTPAAKQSINTWLTERERNYNPQENALFITIRGTRMTARAVQLVIEKAVKATGLPKAITAHKLRHTAATMLYKHGHVDIRALKEILGHESLSTTEVYTHIDDEQLQTAVNTNPLAGVVNRKRKLK